MSENNSYQLAFYNSHFYDDHARAEKMIVPNELTTTQKLSIYRNNIFISLTEALAQTFPVVEKLVGEDFFAFTANIFIKKHPPKQGPLFEYGEEYPIFLTAFEPASSLPYLPDIARLEWAMNTSYHAKNIEPIDAKHLSIYTENEFSLLKLDPHPSIRLISSDFPIYDIWLMNQNKSTDTNIELDKKSNTIVYRPEEQVMLRELDDDVFAFVESLSFNLTIENSYAAALRINPDFDPAMTLVDLLSMGLFSAAINNTRPSPQTSSQR